MTTPEQAATLSPHLKHSGMGISSFVISIAAGVAMFILIAVALAIDATTPGGMDHRSTSAIVIGVLIIVFLGLDLIAVGLGIAGALQKQRKKIFAVLGTIFAAMTIACTIILMIVALAMK